MRNSALARALMVERQMRGRDIRDARVLAAAGRVERERFLPEDLAEFAYDDAPLPIGEGQTMSQPYMVALMAQAAALGPDDRLLEVGTGSGYATAVMSLLCRRVYSIERHRSLGDGARQRLAEGDYDNVELRIGDGTRGWPERAPFDAIVVTAAGAAVPEALKDQLAAGGRLIVPVGKSDGQRLLRITREADGGFREEDLGGVLFVPLVADGSASPAGSPATLASRVAAVMEPLPEIDDAGFGAAFDRFADSRIVLLGEATHGTGEFYRARAAITRHLVERHGFTIVAVEADWPDAAALHRRIRGRPQIADAVPAFTRFPTWMWRNREVEDLVEALARLNSGRPAEKRAGFYGLDLYNLQASMGAVIGYLDRVDPEAAATARARYGCLKPWSAAPEDYGRMSKRQGYAKCEDGVVAMLTDLNARALEAGAEGGDDLLDASLNALLVKDAEAYYRAMYHGSAESWNLRDRHMFDTLCRLLDAKGPAARAVVWAHNSHIGDARATDMGRTRGELNLGQLVRERFGEAATLIGFGTHCGRVAAADDWDEPMRIMDINPSRPESLERLFHDTGVERGLLDLRARLPEGLRADLARSRLERFIGVIYRPDTERWSHYVSCALSDQFDAWVWFDRTSPVTPLPCARDPGPGVDETFPSGL